MLSAAVKADLAAQLPGVMIMDRFGSSEAGAQGAVEVGASGPRFVMSDDTAVLDDDLRPLAPGDGRIGRLARTGRIPLGYYKDEAKTAATFPTDADGVRWSVPGRPGLGRARRRHHRARARLGVDQLGRREDLPRGGRGGRQGPPRRVRRHRGRPARRALRRTGGRRRPPARRVPTGLDARGRSRTTAGRHIAGYKVPRQLLLVDEIPLTAAGKPDAKAAKALF